MKHFKSVKVIIIKPPQVRFKMGLICVNLLVGHWSNDRPFVCPYMILHICGVNNFYFF